MPRSCTNIDKVKSRHWCFTLNNPEGGAELYDTDGWNACAVHYMIVALEFAPTTGTPHHQGYVHWQNPRFGAAMKKLMPQAHWTACLGTERDNDRYCRKDGNIILCVGDVETDDDEKEAGIPAPRQGKRSDIDRARDMVEAGETWAYIVGHITSYSALRVAEAYMTVAEPPRMWKTHVTWVYGPTGTGKTHLANQLCQTDPWVSGQNLKWFNDYDGHKDAIIDEFRGDFCPFHELLRLTDALRLRVEVKRGNRQWRPRRLVITSCHPPHRVYKDRTTEDLRQLGRRIEVIIYIPQRGHALWAPGNNMPGTAETQWDPVQPFELPTTIKEWMPWVEAPGGRGGNTGLPGLGPSGLSLKDPPLPPRTDNLAYMQEEPPSEAYNGDYETTSELDGLVEELFE